jgi:uncharacterized protein
MSAIQSANTVDASNANDSVALVIQHRLRPGSFDRYEQWLRVIGAKAAEYPGHMGLHVIRPSAGGNDYTMIVRFATMADVERWISSDDRKRLIGEIADALEHEDQFHIHPGIEYWFTPPSPTQKRPSAWKQWLITTSVIWPLTMAVPPVFKPLFNAVPVLGTWGVRHAIIASAIVALVVFVIMPRYVRAVSGWLYR